MRQGSNRIEWDLPSPFVIDLVVEPDDVDDYGHTNNLVYVRWCEQVAWAHTEAVGLGMPEYRRLGRAMAATRTEILYQRPSFAGERVRVANWIVDSDWRLRAIRRYQIVRKADGVTLARALSTFVCIDLDSGRPRRMPGEFRERYVLLPEVAAAMDEASWPFAQPRPSPPGPSERRRPLPEAAE